MNFAEATAKQSLNQVEVGEDVKIFDFVNAYRCKIGDRTKVGTFVEIQNDVLIGSDCKISSHSFLCEGVELEDQVFIGHNVTFINDRFPRSTNEDGSMQTAEDWTMEKTFVGKRASIGSSVTIMCGVKIGAGAIVGAGSVVLKDVEPNTIVAGNPAKFIRKV